MEIVRNEEFNALTKEVSTELAYATKLFITDQETFDVATQFVGKHLNKKIKKVKEWHDPRKKSAKATHDLMCADEKAHLAPLLLARTITDAKVKVYVKAEQIKIDKENERLAGIARDKHQKDIDTAKNKIAGLLGHGRKKEEEVKLLQTMIDSPDSSEVEVTQAVSRQALLLAEIEGNKDKIAEAALKVTETPPDPAAMTSESKPKSKGFSHKVVFKAEITDKKKLIAAIANPDTVWGEDLIAKFDMVAIERLLNAKMTVPGVRGVPKDKTGYR